MSRPGKHDSVARVGRMPEGPKIVECERGGEWSAAEEKTTDSSPRRRQSEPDRENREGAGRTHPHGDSEGGAGREGQVRPAAGRQGEEDRGEDPGGRGNIAHRLNGHPEEDRASRQNHDADAGAGLAFRDEPCGVQIP